MGPWYRTILGFSGGALITAIATRYGNGASLWIALGAGVIMVVTLAHGWAWPRWMQRRAGRHESGYLKITGGFRSDNRLVIRYKGGRQDTTLMPSGAPGIGVAHSPPVTTGPDGPWMSARKWLANKLDPS
jgi:hypothetical protein